MNQENILELLKWNIFESFDDTFELRVVEFIKIPYKVGLGDYLNEKR
jgi:hypothetical protein